MSRFQLPLAVATTVFTWACAWVSIRVAVQHLSPAHVALGRYLVASFVLLPIWIYRRPRIERHDWPTIFVMGLCGFTFYNLAINQGEKSITAGAAALIASTIPIFTILGAIVFLKERVKSAAWVGIGLALCGVALIAGGEKGGLHFSGGAILVVIGSACVAAYGLLQKNLLPRYHALDLTTAAIWCGTLSLLPFGSGLLLALRAAPLFVTLHLVFLGVFPAAIGYICWAYALARMPVARLMSFFYLVPVLAVLLGWLLLGEIPAPISLLGGALALGGVIWANWRKNG